LLPWIIELQKSVLNETQKFHGPTTDFFLRLVRVAGFGAPPCKRLPFAMSKWRNIGNLVDQSDSTIHAPCPALRSVAFS
jgi:hypothetical protein